MPYTDQSLPFTELDEKNLYAGTNISRPSDVGTAVTTLGNIATQPKIDIKTPVTIPEPISIPANVSQTATAETKQSAPKITGTAQKEKNYADDLLTLFQKPKMRGANLLDVIEAGAKGYTHDDSALAIDKAREQYNEDMSTAQRIAEVLYGAQSDKELARLQNAYRQQQQNMQQNGNAAQQRMNLFRG